MALKRFVDRDVARWQGRSMLLLSAVVPIILLELAFAGPPSDAPTAWLAVAIAASILILLFVSWRELRWGWRELKHIRQLAETEERDGGERK
ncbi:MAG: hypothetical protein EOP58_07425 [Sphingomonadales bacterium]|nr:MAG: hypothetical protein EOP58_07425 [Sphingomonadales bacterium]